MLKNPFQERKYLYEAKENEGDYLGEDGLLMCGVCHKPKEQKQYRPERNEACPVKRWEKDPDYQVFPANCDCQKQRIADNLAEEQRRRQKDTSDRLRKMGLQDAQYKNTDFSMDDRRDAEASDFCRNWVDDWETARRNNDGIMLYGDVGSGKTFYASCIANALIEKGVPVLMTTLADLELAMSANFRQNEKEILQTIKSVDLLILDDVGKEQTGAAMMEATYKIINTRYKSQKPLIFTTNMTVRAMNEESQTKLKRIFSRLREMCVPLNVNTSDRRAEFGKEKVKTAYERYGKRRA